LFKQAFQFASAMRSFAAGSGAISLGEQGSKLDDSVSLTSYLPPLQKQPLSAGNSSLTTF